MAVKDELNVDNRLDFPFVEFKAQAEGRLIHFFVYEVLSFFSQEVSHKHATFGDASCDTCHFEHEIAGESVPQKKMQVTLQPGQLLNTWFIEEMDCPTEERLIRNRLSQRSSIAGLNFLLMQRKLEVVHQDGDEAFIEQAIKDLGFTPVRAKQGQQESSAVVQEQKEKQKKQLIQIGSAVALALVAEVGDWWFQGNLLWPVLSVVAILLSGVQVYKKGWVAIKNRDLNINALMSIAVTGAVLVGQWPEAAMVMSLFALAEWIEARSLDRARHAVSQLLSIAPDQVFVWSSKDKAWQEAATKEVPAGSLIRIRPGDRIGLDGLVEQGRSEVNQAPITGESVAVDKVIGDFVYAGSINGMGELQIRTQSSAQDSTLARIARAVQDAQQGKAKLERFVDRFSRVYTPIVVVLALLIAVVPPVVGWMGWYEAIYKALVLLVIACPCALVISTPIAVVSGLAVSARHGVLIKGGVYLERLRKLGFLALDKTGTLTTGRPQLVDYCVSDEYETFLAVHFAYLLSSRSDHPVSVAITQGLTKEFNSNKKEGTLGNISIQALPGRGVQSMIDGIEYKLGRFYWAVGQEQPFNDKDEFNFLPESFRAAYEKGIAQGASFVFLSADNQLVALFVLQDTIKHGVEKSIQALQADGVKLAIVSGDTPAAVKHVAMQLGVKNAYGGLLPENKLALIKSQKQTSDRKSVA